MMLLDTDFANVDPPLVGMDRGSLPVFLVGCHRSGSTLARYLFDAHPSFVCPPESKFISGLDAFVSYPQALRGLESLGVTHAETLSYLRRLILDLFEGVARAQGKRRWVDKTPNYWRLLPFIDLVFEHRVLYLLIVRHPLDNIDSLMNLPAFSATPPEDPDIAHAVALYGRSHVGWAKHWTEVNTRLLGFAERAPDRSLVFRYEDLVERTAEVMRRLLAFTGEDCPRDLVRDAFVTPHAVGYEDPRARESRRVYTASVGKWMRRESVDWSHAWKIVEDLATRLNYHFGHRPVSEMTI